MKLLSVSLVALVALYLIGCDRPESIAYTKLKAETGATDEELEESIKSYTKFYVLMRKEIEAGTVNIPDLMDTAKKAKEVMATVQREDEMAAVMTLSHLRTLESKGSQQARAAMARHLSQFVDSESPSTENSKMICDQIREYAETSDAFNALKQESKPVSDEQPAPAPELKPNDTGKPKPESEGRSQ